MHVCEHAHAFKMLSIFSEHVCLSVHVWSPRSSFGVCVHVPYVDVVVGLSRGNVWMSTSVTTQEMRL